MVILSDVSSDNLSHHQNQVNCVSSVYITNTLSRDCSNPDDQAIQTKLCVASERLKIVILKVGGKIMLSTNLEVC